MKKTFLFSMALVAALSSCTKDNVDNNENNDLVAIKLGASTKISTNVTRASRAPLTEWNNTTVGLYALAKNAESWTPVEEDISQPVVLWNNVLGTVATRGTTAITIPGGVAQYYPRQSVNQYSFYGYYPTDGVTPEITQTAVTATYTIDGSQDIIYGKAVAEAKNGKEGYNAAYLREEGAEDPTITFNHLLTQIKFKFRREAEFAPDQDLKVKSIAFQNQPVQLDLVIADNNEDATSGQLTVNAEDQKNSTVSVTIPEAVSITVPDDEMSEDEGNDVGEPAMIYTDNKATASYTALITLTDGNDADIPAIPVTINAPVDPGYFEAGKSYTVSIKIADFTPIVVNATLTDWVDGGVIDGGEI